MKLSPAILILFFLVSIIPVNADAKKIVTKHKAPKPDTGTVYPAKKISESSDSLLFEEIASKITFLAYDKNGSSDKETFFIDNSSDVTITSLSVEITYLTSDGDILHRREIPINLLLPPHEKRRVDISAWDRQKSFHYHLSKPSRSGSSPYYVSIRLVSLEKIN